MNGAEETVELESSSMRGSLYLGEFVPAQVPVDVLEKATGEVLYSGALATADEVAKAALIAKEAQVGWAALPATARGDVLRKFAALCVEHMDEIASWLIRETGSIPGKAPFEIGTGSRDAIEMAGLTTHPSGQILASDLDRRSYARRVPVGVVGVITPWNAPFVLAVRGVIPALAMGNAAVLKPDVQTPLSGGYLLAKLLEMAGLPKGVLCVVPGDGVAGAALTADPNINMIGFTGSTATGRLVAKAAAGSLKKVLLELGGNNAAIIFDDAPDIDSVASATAFGSFFHQGQICFTTGRHLVQEGIVEEYVKALSEHAKNLHVGNPFTEQVHLGPLVNEVQAEKVETLMNDTLAAGGKITAGGTRDGLFYQPTVVTNVDSTMPLFRNETFGPVAPITTFKTEEEAIALANDTEYGFSASVFSTDQGKAIRVAESLKTGMVHINDQSINSDVYAPIGGMGASGNGGRFGLLSAIDEYSQWQWITVNDTVPSYPF